MAKVLVTGGLGYIGSHTVVELIEQSYSVVILDNLANSEIGVLDGIEEITGVRPEFVQADIRNKQELMQVFSHYAPIDAVIHFAADKAVGESVEQPLKYYENNVGGLLHILAAMQEYEVHNIVFSSSCTVYGQPELLPVNEQAPLQPANSPYGRTKQMCEDILLDSTYAYKNLRTIMLRYFNPIGAHPSAIIGELPRGVPNNLVPFITQTVAGLRTELHVFGNDYNTPDGTAIRDYIYVVDLAKAHIAAMQRMLNTQQKTNCEIFNLGTGNGVSVLQMIQSFEQATGKTVPYTFVNRRAGDVEQVWADTTYANEEMGWYARTPLQTILRSAWAWEERYRSIGKQS